MSENSLTKTLIVTEELTADKVGSGLLPVFSTPSLVAFMENTAMQLIELPEGKSSVGIEISVQHLKASPVGAQLTCTATVTQVDGRKYSFSLEAKDDSGDVIGRGTHDRVVIDVQRFMEKVK